jgi:hypothetical protein
MKYINRPFVGLATAGLLLSALVGSAWATPLAYAGVCPQTNGHAISGSPIQGGTGDATDCNLLIVFNADGSITTTAGLQTTFEGIDDALIGVVNNSGHPVTSFALTGGAGDDIFGFEGDGIDVYLCPASGSCSASNFSIATNTSDVANGNTGYGGPLAFFTGIDASTLNTGTVNIGFGGLGTGTGNTDCSPLSPGTNHSVTGGACNSTYFSLEGPADLNTTVGTVPEPATMTLLGTGLACRLLRRRKRQS